MIIDTSYSQGNLELSVNYAKVQASRTVRIVNFMRKHGKILTFPRRFKRPNENEYRMVEEINPRFNRLIEADAVELLGVSHG